MISETRVPQRERRRRHPADNRHDHCEREDRQADPTVVVSPTVDVVQVFAVITRFIAGK
jgi:hypothetical protein